MWKFDYEFGLTPLLGCSWLSVKRGYLRVNPVSGFLLPFVVVDNGTDTDTDTDVENENENEECE